ncbi:MAG: hypothetical protein LLG15_04715 [Betaproteobacteria bacterium]|nr:hypothetical protein [Betaproteobacteria bacterium]
MPRELKPGACYSNGDFGRHWTVRQIVSISEVGSVTYKVLAGVGRRRSETCSREEFQSWVRYEVIRNENSWIRLTA